jgi:hypothetical protein
MLVLERLLHVFAALRISIPKPPVPDKAILPMDYRAVKAMLTHLPLTPVDRKLSAGALVTAATVFRAVKDGAYQLSLPDRSGEGNKWFTREDGRAWTDLGYNTVKAHLGELENAGVLLTTRAEGHRGRGKQIHFRFDPNVEPPFQSRNLFDALPDLSRDAYPQ